MFCTFSLQNVLFATAACNFWFIRRPPDSAPAALTGLLFDWPDTRIIEKTQHFVTSLTFSADVSSFTWLSHYCIFCRLTWLLCCCALHLLFNSPYCRKFLFKLPSTIDLTLDQLPHDLDKSLATISHLGWDDFRASTSQQLPVLKTSSWPARMAFEMKVLQRNETMKPWDMGCGTLFEL